MNVKIAVFKAAGLGGVMAATALAGGIGYGAYQGGKNIAYNDEMARQRSMRNKAFGAGIAAGYMGPSVMQGAGPTGIVQNVSNLLNVNKMTGAG